MRGLRLDYTHTPARKAIEKAAGQKVKKVAENPQPELPPSETLQPESIRDGRSARAHAGTGPSSGGGYPHGLK